MAMSVLCIDPADVRGFNGRHIHVNEALSMLGLKKTSAVLNSANL